MTGPAGGQPAPQRPRRADVVAWLLWDSGSSGLSAIVGTFVFSVYLVSAVGADVQGATSAASWLGRTLTIAGFTVAALAPAIGVWVQDPGRRRVALTLLTASAVIATAAMSAIGTDVSYLFLGLALLGIATGSSDLAGIPYNSMLVQVTTPQHTGRISGLGWAAGYLGSVVLLTLLYAGFIVGSDSDRGFFGLPAADGVNVRVAMVATAIWFAVLALPLLLRAGRIGGRGPGGPPRIGVVGAYRQVWTDLAAEWHRDRNLVRYLLASALYRDGLVGIFVFGPVLGVGVYGVATADVMLFGMAASVAAAVGAVAGGLLDDRIGAKPVILTSLVVMTGIGSTLLAVSGPAWFWVLGLMLAVFVGPIQATSRALLIRMAGSGREGVAFGLYTMTGRAVTFLAPWLFSVFIDVFGAVRAGLGGLLTVLVAGLLMMLTVREPVSRVVG